MAEVFLTTVQKVAILLIFIGIGYLLRRKKVLPDDASKVLSKLATMAFYPAYTINNLSQNVTMENISQKVPLVFYGVLFVVLAVSLALLLSRLLSHNDLEKRSLTYAFSIPNYGYFGFPIIEGVFGPQILADIMIFTIPLSIVTHTYGYMLFIKENKTSVLRLFRNPPVLGVIIGVALGLSGIRLPALVREAISSAAACMSPISMILAGFVLGAYPLKKLMKGFWAYEISDIRLIGIPAVFCAVLYLVGIRGEYLLLPLLILSMPLGLNLVVFPESLGEDASENAKLCFVSYILAVFILPITFSVISWLASLT